MPNSRAIVAPIHGLCAFFRPLLTPGLTAPSLPASQFTVCTSRFTRPRIQTQKIRDSSGVSWEILNFCFSEIAKTWVRKPRVFINCHSDPPPKPTIPPPPKAPQNLLLQIYENPGFPVSKHGVSQPQGFIRNSVSQTRNSEIPSFRISEPGVSDFKLPKHKAVYRIQYRSGPLKPVWAGGPAPMWRCKNLHRLL